MNYKTCFWSIYYPPPRNYKRSESAIMVKRGWVARNVHPWVCK